MADLDDFFKKKDTKRSKGTKKTNSKSEVKVKKQENPIRSSLLKDSDPFSNADDGWKDIEEESKKDYSGLKIQNLQLNDVDGKEKSTHKQESDEETEVNDQGETVKKSAGPWRKVEIPESEEKKVEAVAPPVEEKKPQEESVYVPPSLRIKNKITTKPIKKTGNNLSCKESFPELGVRK